MPLTEGNPDVSWAIGDLTLPRVLDVWEPRVILTFLDNLRPGSPDGGSSYFTDSFLFFSPDLDLLTNHFLSYRALQHR